MVRHELGQFAKVKQISTKSISPEIDLLSIREQSAVGYELKLLKYNKKLKRVDLDALYSGIGQMFLYLNHGVDRSYLVIGLSPTLISGNVSSTIAKVEEATKLLKMLRDIPSGYRYPYRQEQVAQTYNLDCVGIMLWNPSTDSVDTKLEATRDFLAVKCDANLKHLNTCVINKEFKYDKKFLEKRKG
jgi:hypothetical protein